MVCMVRTSYSGDKWLKVGRRRRCHHGDNRTESENRACQLIDTGLLTFSIRKEARKYKLLCRFYNTLFSGSGSRLWQLLLNCMVSQVRTTEYNTKHNNTKGSCQKKNVFFLGYLSQICFPTHPPQGFCEIWENKRWNLGRKRRFSGQFGGVLRGLDIVWESVTPPTHIWERYPKKNGFFFWQPS